MSAATRLERATHAVCADHAELRVERGTVVITKQAVTQDAPVEVRLDASRLRGADLQKPGRGSTGWLHVSAIGGTPRPPSELAAASDPYTVPVTARNLGAARRFARLVGDHVRQRGLPHESADDGARSTSVLLASATDDRQPEASPRPAVPPPGAPAAP